MTDRSGMHYDPDAIASLELGLDHPPRTLGDTAGEKATALLRRLAPDDPMHYVPIEDDHTQECFWCYGAWGFATCKVEHARDCAWVAARRFLGLPLGDHTVNGEVSG